MLLPELHFSLDEAGLLKIDLTSPPTWLTGVQLALPGQVITHIIREPENLPPLPMYDIISVFIDYLRVNEDYKPKSLHNYRIRLGQFASWLDNHPDLSARKPETWVAYYAFLKRDKGYSPYTLKGHHQILTHFGTWLVEKKYLSIHPIAEVKPPKTPKNQKPKAIEKEAISKILQQATEPRERALLLFFRDTACRADEALQLTWGQLKLDEGTTDILGKGDKARSLFFKRITGRALKKYRLTLKSSGSGDPVWPGENGPLSYDGLYKIFKRLAISAEIEGDFSPHSWRHAFGRDATLAGMPTAALQKIMGHENMSTTQIYTLFKTSELQHMHDEYSPVDGDFLSGFLVELLGDDDLTQRRDVVK